MWECNLSYLFLIYYEQCHHVSTGGQQTANPHTAGWQWSVIFNSFLSILFQFRGQSAAVQCGLKHTADRLIEDDSKGLVMRNPHVAAWPNNLRVD